MVLEEIKKMTQSVIQKDQEKDLLTRKNLIPSMAVDNSNAVEVTRPPG